MINWWRVYSDRLKGGVLGTGQVKKRGLRHGSGSRKGGGGLRHGSGKKGGSLLRHIPVLAIYVSAPPPPGTVVPWLGDEPQPPGLQASS